MKAEDYPLCDILLDNVTFQKYLKNFTNKVTDALPASYDARNAGIVSPAKNQGSCGSCWAFASVGAMESHIKKTYPTSPLYDLSEQQQVSCNDSMWGCQGGDLKAIQFWETKGPNLESDYPYTSGNGYVPSCIPDHIQLGYRITNFNTYTGTENFKASLYYKGPSYWRFNVYSDFCDYWNAAHSGSVYINTSNSQKGGHAVLIIGWDDAKGAFLCKNSWRAKSGPNDDGTFWIAYTGHANDLYFEMCNFDVNNTDTLFYNSPARRLILTEVNWSATTWISEVQITDMSGGSTVQVYYNSGVNRRGPFPLWTNSGGFNRSISFANILKTIDSLDVGAFTYLGTNGALEFITQDTSQLIQAAVSTYSGNSSRTFPALADVEANTATAGRNLLIPDISNNTTYRPSVVLFNPSADNVTVDVKIIGNNGAQIGSTISRTLAGYQMNTISAEVRANTYSNANILITVTSETGRVLASGQTANNNSNDPAAHLAVQTGAGYANSPEQRKILTEVNWAAASGGGIWTSEVQLIDMSGGSVVQVYYNSGTNRRGPFTLWSNDGGVNQSVHYDNILQTIDGLDAGAFTYLGTSGALEFITQDSNHLIHVSVRTRNGNYSRTFPALGDLEANTASVGRNLLILNISNNISNNATSRALVVLFNPSVNSVTVDVKIIGSNGRQIGSTINRTLAGHQMNTISSEVLANTYSNATILITPIAGTGRVLASGQTANNPSNDPDTHIAVQAQ
jgi:hypothetical protein